ncbi:MAG: serine hydrolase [Actinomycetota bacterium]|nr:serine hydrolase [Actinomycetota bacterium]
MTGVGKHHLRRLLLDFRDRFAVPALGAATVTRTGTLAVDVVGSRQRGGCDPVTVDDQWHIGSCAKAITSALYARLVEQGDTEWAVPVRAFFPDLADSLDVGWSGPTVDEVLVCRSGMRTNLSRAELLKAWEDTSPMTEQRTRAVVSALSRPPDRRGAFRYSNLGYVIVGAAIDRIAEMPFEDALRINLLEPLGITSAGFGPPPDIWGHRPRFQLGSLTIGRGSPAEPGSPRSDNPAVLTPAGRLHLTLADWAKFQQLFLNQGHDLLKPATIEHLLTLPADKSRGMAMGWASAANLDGASYGMQGSNTLWAATAIIDANLDRTAMVVANDGRTRLLSQSAQLAASILRSH